VGIGNSFNVVLFVTIQLVDLNPVIPAQKAVAKASYPHPVIPARFWRESSSMRKLYSALALDSRLRENDGAKG
jgi:hypothetical protein